ncbi:uncharacterized protein LOC143912920 [Arctopsyche grandis]|uniref:uncharacterized protein LOC143912920 n=1 Tax=Arctopsyche grandis TaxID=121162 RepID=UPI00406D69AE
MSFCTSLYTGELWTRYKRETMRKIKVQSWAHLPPPGLIENSQIIAILEPVTQALQAVQVDLPEVQLQVQNLLSVVKLHRGDSDNYFRDIFEKTVQLARKVDIELIIPRQCGRQKHRSNPGTISVEEYFRQTVYIPYLDSLINSMESRFCEANSAQFNLALLHPSTESSTG